MTQVTATFETGVNGNTISTGDTGSATAFDAVTIGTSCIAAYDTTHVANGTLAAKLASQGTSAASFLEWSTAFGTLAATYYNRFYLYLTANPAATMIVCQGLNAAAGAFRVQVTTAGKIALTDKTNTVRATSATSLSLNQFVRVELAITPSVTVGGIECKIFNTATSSSADETFDTTFVWDLIATHDHIRFGLISNSTSYSSWWDNIVGGAASYPGPVSTAAFVPKIPGYVVT